MKNILKYSFFIGLLISFVSCEEDGIPPFDIPSAISFNLESDEVQVQPGGSEYELQLQTTAVSNSDRTFTIKLNENQSTGLT